MTLGSIIKESLATLALPAHGHETPMNAIVLVDTLKDIVPERHPEHAAKNLYDFISSDAFASEVDKEVGDPSEGESEDQYVQRARTQIEKLLMARFKE
jgi:hypothetical protein